MKRRIRLTESDLHKVIKEAVKNIIREEYEKKEVFTINAFDIENEEDVTEMKYSVDYYSEDEAVEAAREMAKDFIDFGSVVMVSVFAGEYEDENGNVFGDPEAIYTISNSDRETTSIARKAAGYVSEYVDEYVI